MRCWRTTMLTAAKLFTAKSSGSNASTHVHCWNALLDRVKQKAARSRGGAIRSKTGAIRAGLDKMTRIIVMFSTINGAYMLPRMLDTLECLDAPAGGWKIVAVDSGSGDDCLRILQKPRPQLGS